MNTLKNYFSRNKNVFADTLTLFLIATIFFMRWIFRDHYALFASDIVQDFSMHHFIALSFGQGKFPLWDPYFFGNIIGYLNSGIFYPFNLLMDLMQIPVINNLNNCFLIMEGNVFFHYFLASFFMYLLLVKLKISRFPAIISSLVFAYSGYLVKEYLHLAYLEGAVWLPLVFLFYYKASEERYSYAVLSGLFYGISLLSGQTQPAIYYAVITFLFSAYKIFDSWEKKEKFSFKPVIIYVIFLITAFGLFAIQFYSTKEYAKYSMRSDMSYNESVGASVDPLYYLIHPLVPNFWGSMSGKSWEGDDLKSLSVDHNTKWLNTFFGGLPNEMNYYLGLLPFLMLAIVGFSSSKFIRNYFLILFFFSGLLMLSRSLPLIGTIYYYFLGGASRVPARAAIIWSFSLSVITALGFQILFSKSEDLKLKVHEFLKPLLKTSLPLIFLFMFLMIILTLSAAGTAKMTYFYFPMLNAYSLFVILSLAYTFLLLATLKTKSILPAFFLGLLFVVELFSYHFENSYIIHIGSSPEVILKNMYANELNILKNDKEYFKVDGLGLAAYANNLFGPGYGTAGSAGFAYRPYLDLYGLAKTKNSPIYDLLNIKYFFQTNKPENNLLLDETSKNESDLIVVKNSRLTFNKDFMPRAFLVYSYRLFNGKDEMFSALSSQINSADFKKTAYLYSKPLGFPNPEKSSEQSSRATIDKYDLQKVTIRTESEENGILILTDPYFPGWKARVDGVETRVFSAYHALRAIVVPKGQHQVVFYYEARPIMFGFKITLMTIMAIVIYFILITIKNLK